MTGSRRFRFGGGDIKDAKHRVTFPVSVDGELKRVAMSDLSSVQVLDPELQKELARALKAQLGARKPRPPPSLATAGRLRSRRALGPVPPGRARAVAGRAGGSRFCR